MLIGATGSLLVFRDEIEALTYPELMTTVGRHERVSVQHVLDVVRHAYPQDSVFSLRMPRKPQQVYLLKMNDANSLFVYVDPYSGKLIGSHQQKDTFMGWIAVMHTQLLLGEQGKTILGVSGLLLMVMSGAGIFLWWPRKGKISQGFQINWSGAWKKRVFNMHRVCGIYSVFFLLVIGLTGASLVFNKTASGITDFLTASPPRPAPPLSGHPGAEHAAPPLDELLRQADRLMPAPTTWISFPQTPRAPLVVRKKTSAESHPNGRNFIYFDQYNGDVLLVENASTAPLGTRIYNVFYPLHVGTIGGLSTRILQMIVGFLPLILFITGYIMWRNRGKGSAHKKSMITFNQRRKIYMKDIETKDFDEVRKT